MFTVAVCDNEKVICDRMREFSERYAKEKNIAMDIMTFFSGEDLYEALTGGDSFDLIFLDIEMNRLSGLDVAKAIREFQDDLLTQIVYISAQQQYAMELFETHPLNFLVKPLEYESVAKTLHKAIRLKMKRGEIFSYSIKGETHRVPISNILYFESCGRKLRIVRTGDVEEFYGRISDLTIRLTNKRFVQIHKSYIVNIDYIDFVDGNNITMYNGDILPLSRDRKSDFMDALLCAHMDLERET